MKTARWGTSAVLAVLFAGVAPEPLRASGGDAVFRSRPPEVWPSRGSTGGVVTLRQRPSEFVRLPELELELGSTMPEVLEAVADCSRESLSAACDERTFANETPARKTRVPAFYLSRTEVTVREYSRCVKAGRCSPPAFPGSSRFDRPDYPVTFVDWEQARSYCRFRGMRLPTEAEFERAARGASRRRYPWGQLWNRRRTNHGRLGADPTDSSDGFVELAPVGSFPDGSTPEGVLDLAGNVAEWVLDSYAEFPGGPPLTGIRVLRGGDFQKPAPWLRAAARLPQDPSTRAPFIGFRCAKAAQLREGSR